MRGRGAAVRGRNRALGARDGWSVPLRFADPTVEMEAATLAAGLVDRSYLGRLRLGGRQRAAYLHRVSAHAVKDLTPPAGTRAAVLERTGKIVDVLTLHAFPDHLLALTSAARRGVARAWLKKVIFREDVQVQDVTAETC